jgi:[ribosomal protein S5]-alanine N-acetyltransferase
MKKHPPTLETDRLILRPFSISDSERVKELAGDKRIYETTLNVPHPYEDGMAEKWISSHLPQFYNGNGVNLAVTLKGIGELIGAIGLGAAKPHKRAELGYWIGVPFWNKGYCTEAAKEIIEYGFKSLGYHKITSRHLESNPASGKVMEKAGMLKEGRLIDEVVKDGNFHTLIVFGIINCEQNASGQRR